MHGDKWRTHPRGRHTTIYEDLPTFKWIRWMKLFGDMILGTRLGRVFIFWRGHGRPVGLSTFRS